MSTSKKGDKWNLKGFFTKDKFILVGIILIAILFRFYNVNWDSNTHLHPDERFLTMVGNAMKIPVNFFDYFNPAVSTLNPTNVGFNFYVYGTFPVILNKLIAVLLGNDTYDLFVLQGRILSAFFDVITVLFVYGIVDIFEKEYRLDKHLKFLSALFYAISVLPIQLSHFFTTDTFFNTFSIGSFYFILKYFYSKKSLNYVYLILSAIFIGLAISSKISAFFIIPLIAVFVIDSNGYRYFKNNIFKKKSLFHIWKYFLTGCIFFLFIYLTLRIFNPYYFETANFLDITPNNHFITNIQSLKSYNDINTTFPPSIQWITKKPILFALQNLAFFGLGLPFFGFVIWGGVRVLLLFIKRKSLIPLTILLMWVLLFFLYQSTQFVKSMRYFIMIYPMLAIYAAIGLQSFLTQYKKYNKKNIISILAFILVFIWPICFFSIYTKDQSRVAASKWIYNNIAPGSVLLSEYWDDALPLSLPNQISQTYENREIGIFNPDSDPNKWYEISESLSTGDYLILSSNRGWGSMTTIPKRYPTTTKFYNDLFAGKTNYKKVAEFTSYPGLKYLGIPVEIPDQWAEEAFTVYDHPKVMIFKKEISFQ